MKERLIIAIDGPAGSGKSTVARLVAEKLGLLYVDTGAMYRALTLKAMRKQTDLEDKTALVKLAAKTSIELKTGSGPSLKVILDGEDVTEAIRSSQVTNNVKYVAAVAGVRRQMVSLQRKAASSGAVLEGRDIGTVVFPDADTKIFLKASPEERVKRRYRELKEKGHKVTLDEIRRDVETRDLSDEMRQFGPLKQAEDALVIDTTGLAVRQVVEKVLAQVRPHIR